MEERKTARLGFTATGALLIAVGSALVSPATVASPSATPSAQATVSVTPRPVMWIDCEAMSWVERLWSKYC